MNGFLAIRLALTYPRSNAIGGEMKGDKCSISNCKNIITYKGTVCGTHKWRMTKYKSYDLPSHEGHASYYIHEKWPEGIIHKCTKNHGLLTIDDVYIRKDFKKKGGDGVQYHCKKCARDGNIRRNYKGMNSMECYQKMWDSQKGLCYICKQPSTQKSNNSKSIKSLAVDHDHVTGQVRKLLCGACNSLLGYANDSILRLQDCINYLQEHAPD